MGSTDRLAMVAPPWDEVRAVAAHAFEAGIMAVAPPVSRPETRLFRLAMELAVSGAEPETIMELLDLLLLSSGPAFRRLSANRLAVEAARLVLEGEEPSRLINCILSSDGALPSPDTPSPPLIFEIGAEGPAAQPFAYAPSAPILSDGGLRVRGEIPDGMIIRTAGSLTIEGHVGAAALEAGGDLIVFGSVNGKGRGHLRCGGELRAYALERIDAEVGGTATVESAIFHAIIRAGGDIRCEGGAMVGGSLSADGSISAGQLGARLCGRTDISAGLGGPGERDGPAPAASVRVSGLAYDRVRVRVGAASIELRSAMQGVEFREEGRILRARGLPGNQAGPAFEEGQHV